MVARPIAMPVTTPALSTRATLLSLDDQHSARSAGAPSESRTIAASVVVRPTTTRAVSGATAIDGAAAALAESEARGATRRGGAVGSSVQAAAASAASAPTAVRYRC